MDYRLRTQNGLEILRDARTAGITTPVILLTGQGDRSIDQQALAAGASDFLVKGEIAPATLERSVRYSIAQSRAEESLRSQSEFTDAVLNTASVLALVLDREGRIVRFNHACEQTSGWAAAEVYGACVWESLFPFTQSTVNTKRGDALHWDSVPNQYEVPLRTKEGKVRQIVWRSAPLMDLRGRHVEFLVCIGIDVTEQRMVEEALAASRQREVEVGAAIQSALLVRQPPTDFPELSFGVFSQPSLRIDGDFFDFFTFEGGVLDVLVGDVMGKGVAAALLAAAAKSHFQRVMRRLTLSMRHYGRLPEPHEVVSAVHKLLTPELQRLNSFVTLTYARLDLHQRTLTLVDCGAPPLLHWQAATGRCMAQGGDNMPIGMNAVEVYRQYSRTIAPGDVLLFYSDGLMDAYNGETDEYFGLDRLKEVIAQNSGSPPTKQIQCIMESIVTFVGDVGKAEFDDLTCVAIRIEGTQSSCLRTMEAREFISDPEETDRIRAWLNELLQRYFPAVSEEDALRAEIGLIEAFGNIVRHAYQNQYDRPIYLEAEIYAERLLLRLLDWGEVTFTPEDVSDPSFDGSVGGYGFYILRQSYDAVDFCTDELGRNVLLLTKAFSQSATRMSCIENQWSNGDNVASARSGSGNHGNTN